MDFELCDEQRLLKDSVERLLAAHFPFDERMAVLAGRSPRGGLWPKFAEAGLLALPFAEADGGFGGGPVETMIVMEAFGRALVIEPWLGAIVLAGGVLRRGASAENRARLVPALAAGELRLALAHAEPRARWRLAHVETRAERAGAGWRLTGRKALVLGGAEAERFVVSARRAGAAGDADGLALFEVGADAPGLEVMAYDTEDGQRAADLVLRDVALPEDALLGPPADAYAALARAHEEAIAAIVAEAVGVMDEAVAMTVEYLKTRRQFGVAIGSFQALQHRAADMFVAAEMARSAAVLAVQALDEPDGAPRAAAIAAAKAQAAASARFVGEQAVQLHGGIGVTMEYKVGHLFKRLTVIDKQFGDRDHHLGRIAAGESLVAV